jgi:hypothetical protein
MNTMRNGECGLRNIRGDAVAFVNFRLSAIGGGHKRRRAGNPLVWA